MTTINLNGDGAHDDTLALQRALDAVASGGGTIYFHPNVEAPQDMFHESWLDRLRLYYEIFRINWSCKYEKMMRKIVWHLPHGIVSWCGIRLWANATTGEFEHETPGGVSMDTVIRRWDNRHGGDPSFRKEKS